ISGPRVVTYCFHVRLVALGYFGEGSAVYGSATTANEDTFAEGFRTYCDGCCRRIGHDGVQKILEWENRLLRVWAQQPLLEELKIGPSIKIE
ncbi:hypothetical protein ACHAXS_005286, partial [Conticribra weissflogii]